MPFLQASKASFDYLEADDEKKFELLKILLWNLKLENQEVQCYQLKQPYQLMAEAPKNMDLNQWLPLLNLFITINWTELEEELRQVPILGVLD